MSGKRDFVGSTDSPKITGEANVIYGNDIKSFVTKGVKKYRQSRCFRVTCAILQFSNVCYDMGLWCKSATGVR